MRNNRPWIRKTLKEKRESVVSKAHARPTFCLMCEIRIMPKDRASHRERCNGRQVPESLDDWITEAAVKARGMSLVTARRLAKKGSFRTREVEGVVEYLTRDIEQFLDAERLFG